MLGPSVGYVDLLDEAILDQANNEKRKFSPLRPSAAGTCTRSLAYQMMEYHGKAQYEPEKRTPAVHRLLNLGNSIEWHVISEFQKLNKQFAIKYKQQALSFEYLQCEEDPKMSQWVEGSLDLVLWSDKYKAVADVKSKKDSFYQGGWKGTTRKLKTMASVKVLSDQAFWVEELVAFLDELNDAFFAANFLQLNMYANSQFLKERGVDHGVIIQYNKNSSEIREVRFKPSAELYQKTLEKYKAAMQAAAKNAPETAPRSFEPGSISCKFCRFASICPANGGETPNQTGGHNGI
jgi:CRISPR/Cas system-associated exonuclease Cas4 (RecB family)